MSHEPTIETPPMTPAQKVEETLAWLERRLVDGSMPDTVFTFDAPDGGLPLKVRIPHCYDLAQARRITEAALLPKPGA